MDDQRGKGSVALQVHKWEKSHFKCDLSQFREGFISPSKKLMLLIAYQYEALLVPLVTASSCESHEGVVSTASDNDIFGTSTSGVEESFSSRCKYSGSDNTSFIFDVKSFAWGHTYDAHKDVFREFLFVCGNGGVIVHCFRNFDEVSLTSNAKQADPIGKGNWATWDPESANNVDGMHRGFSEPVGDDVDAENITRYDGALCKSIESDTNEFSRTKPSKSWLCSFFTTTKTLVSEGVLITKYPERASFPCAADVVSFKILDTDFPFRDLCSVKTASRQNVQVMSSSIRISDQSSNVPCNCLKIFSSKSYQLIGFFLQSCLDVDENEASSWQMKDMIIVAKLEEGAIKWIFMVELVDSRNKQVMSSWVDFCFSDNYIVCLNAYGVILLCCAMTGSKIAQLNIFETCRLNPKSDVILLEKFDLMTNELKKGSCEGSNIQYGFSGGKCLKKLIVSPDSSIMAVIDGNGVVYVVSARAQSWNSCYGLDKNSSNFQLPYLGFYSCYSSGSYDIDQTMAYSSLSSTKNNINGNSNLLRYMDWKSSLKMNVTSSVDDELCLSGFCFSGNFDNGVHDSGDTSCRMRDIFLPTDRYSDEDSFCFSPFGLTRLVHLRHGSKQRCLKVVHMCSRSKLQVLDDSCLNVASAKYVTFEETFVGEAIGCIYHGWLYLITSTGISVILPSFALSPSSLPVEAIGYFPHGISEDVQKTFKGLSDIIRSKESFSTWSTEVIDKILLFEGYKEAETLCTDNGWTLEVPRLRRLQLSLHYLIYDEIEQSLENLDVINMAEEGILRLLLAATNLILNGNENDVSAASRLLLLVTRFTPNVIRRYGFIQNENYDRNLQMNENIRVLYLPPIIPHAKEHGIDVERKLEELSRFMETARKLQYRIDANRKSAGHDMVDNNDCMMNGVVQDNDLQLSTASADALLSNSQKSSLPSNDYNLAIVPSENSIYHVVEDDDRAIGLVPQGLNIGPVVLPFENAKDMIARWKLGNLDSKIVVRDALLSGRLPLAVLQLHLDQRTNSETNPGLPDTFSEVRLVGKSFAYDLFMKGETGLAIATLQKLGEDVETCLKQLLYGTLRKSLRIQIAEELRRFGILGSYDWKILDKALLMERLYPVSKFWKAFHGHTGKEAQPGSILYPPISMELYLLPSSSLGSIVIECGEVDGVVLGSWTSFSGNYPEVNEEESVTTGYWTAAAIWYNFWDQRTLDRIVLDRRYLMGVHVMWESELEYFVYHNNWNEVRRLIDLIPFSSALSGTLRVTLDDAEDFQNVGTNNDMLEYKNYICSIEEVVTMYLDVPDVRISEFSSSLMCSEWLRILLEQELAKKLIFLKEYWNGTTDFVSLLSRAGFICSEKLKLSEVTPVIMSFPNNEESDMGIGSSTSIIAIHKLIIHHCVHYGLPNLLDLYLEYHNVLVNNDSINSLLDAAGDCQWAKWLLLSRVIGREYDASFCNVRSILSPVFVSDSTINPDIEIHTVDDIAGRGSELAALATLIYASDPIQSCLSRGTIRRSSSSTQCTLENLRDVLQEFSTLWRSLVSAVSGQDTTANYFGSDGNNVLSEYLNWRDSIFHSSSHDTSLLQILPSWMPKDVRRLIQIYIQGPLGWQSLLGMRAGDALLHKEVDFCVHADESTEINALSWEATVQKLIMDEHFSHLIKESDTGIEHHLLRGRAFAAFNEILRTRVKKLKSERQSGTLSRGQVNVQQDVQTLLGPLVDSEDSLLSTVIPLAITHFEDSKLVASCIFLLELCGVSSTPLHIDITALRRIARFYKCVDNKDKPYPVSPAGSGSTMVSNDIVDSLARSLADEYIYKDSTNKFNSKGSLTHQGGKFPSRAPILVLYHLEKASLPSPLVGKTFGSWLSSGDGDGVELRFKQKTASNNWSLVTMFCQIHQLPISTKFLSLLAKDNDWVGFLSEAQKENHSFETTYRVAANGFSDPKLRTHILNVLRVIHSKKGVGLLTPSDSRGGEIESNVVDQTSLLCAELFRVLAESEKQKYPGRTLLKRAKEMSWSVLAMIASCFPDVSPVSCLTVWLEITAARETSSIKVNDVASRITTNVGAAVEVTNKLPTSSKNTSFKFNRHNPKRRRLMETSSSDSVFPITENSLNAHCAEILKEEVNRVNVKEVGEITHNVDEERASLANMVAVLCEQRLFLPLLRAFEMFLPSCSLLPFIRALQAFSQMRISEASAHLSSFSTRLKDESSATLSTTVRDGSVSIHWISSTAVLAANAVLMTCPSPYEKITLLQLLADTDYADRGAAATSYRRNLTKIKLADRSLRKDITLNIGDEVIDDVTLLTSLERNGQWEQARSWARQLETSVGTWKSAVHHVTETQAESMVSEWKEFLWDVPEERVALWGHCQTLFIKYSFPPLQAGLFFLRHAEDVEKDVPARELLEILLLSMQWLSGMITETNPVYPMHLLREIESRVWLLAVESEAQVKNERDFTFPRDLPITVTSNMIDKAASFIVKMDNHLNAVKLKSTDKFDVGGNLKTKRRIKSQQLSDGVDKITAMEEIWKNDMYMQDDNMKMEVSISRWEEKLGPEELERAVLSLLEFGQVTASKQLQYKLSPTNTPPEFKLIDIVLYFANVAINCSSVSLSMIDDDAISVIQSIFPVASHEVADPLQILEALAATFTEGSGRGLCKRIIAVVKAATVLSLSFHEAFNKQPIELLRLLSLKAQDSYEEAALLVQTHTMPASGIAQVLAESFLKGLLAAHRGGYIDSQKEEGPSPLLWRFSEFLKWAEFCPSQPEVGHALMRLVITGQEIPHACEVELLILSHHFYKLSSCLDGVDVLVDFATTRVEAYVAEGEFTCLARLITGVGNFHTLNFILGILIDNGKLDLLLQKYSLVAGTAEAVRGFRMAVLTSLHPHDLDAFAMVYNHFDMKHETATLLESRAWQSSGRWFERHRKDENDDLLESMRYFIEAAEAYSSVDAGNKTHKACAQASLVSLQIRIPDSKWLHLSETNARRLLVDQSRFQEALIVAQAYGLNQPTEWALVLWNQMLKPEIEDYVADFVAVLPLQSSMLVELARFYRAEVAARGDQSQFSVWLSGGVPAEWAKYLGKSFRCLLRRTRDLRLRVQLAGIATGFGDVVDGCNKLLDKLPDNSAPLVLRKGHGGAYLPLM